VLAKRYIPVRSNLITGLRRYACVQEGTRLGENGEEILGVSKDARRNQSKVETKTRFDPVPTVRDPAPSTLYARHIKLFDAIGARLVLPRLPPMGAQFFFASLGHICVCVVRLTLMKSLRRRPTEIPILLHDVVSRRTSKPPPT
jgi:hypothetical protein